jgi:hypothetical protein
MAGLHAQIDHGDVIALATGGKARRRRRRTSPGVRRHHVAPGIDDHDICRSPLGDEDVTVEPSEHDASDRSAIATADNRGKRPAYSLPARPFHGRESASALI